MAKCLHIANGKLFFLHLQPFFAIFNFAIVKKDHSDIAWMVLGFCWCIIWFACLLGVWPFTLIIVS